jgi:hypothetical protein
MSVPATGERRKFPRQKSLLRGRIVFNNQATVVDCVIRDISEGGARLVFSGAVQKPDVFELHIPAKAQVLTAHVHWRHGEDLGVSFASANRVSSTDAPSGESALAERVQRLEDELVALKRAVKKLKTEIGGDIEVA